MKKFLAWSLSDVVFIMLINVKKPTIVGIVTKIKPFWHSDGITESIFGKSWFLKQPADDKKAW